MRCALRFKGDRFATPEEQRREDASGSRLDVVNSDPAKCMRSTVQ
jgi:hypothetical protein